MKDLKRCSGTHKDTYGLGCKTMVNAKNRKLGLGRECLCYSKFLINTPEGNARIKKAELKATKPRRELEKAQKERKQTNTLQNLLQSVVNSCHKYIRLRDKYKPCISCGANWNEHFQSGHFYKAELYSSLKFHPKNINGQCRVCNLHKDGNFEGYRKGMIERYDLKFVQNLEKDARKDKSEPFKWDREQLREERTVYNQMIKELEKQTA